MNKFAKTNTVKLSDGSLECLKWLALLLMTADHISTFLYNGELQYLNNAGRLAFPIFAFVFAYNLNRNNAEHFFKRSLVRLVIFGAAATPFFAYLTNTHNYLPLNILFTLAAGLLCVIAYSKGRYIEAALIVFFVGLTVEYSWVGLALILSAYCLIRNGSDAALYCCLISLASLFIVNGSFYAFLAAPLILLFSLHEIKFPRFKWAFYFYYPLHLAIILIIKVVLT